jgi:hypothetical protein
MGTQVGGLAVRRSIWIDAKPERRGGTLVELFHHGFERLGDDAAENHRGFEGGWGMTQLEALLERVG